MQAAADHGHVVDVRAARQVTAAQRQQRAVRLRRRARACLLHQPRHGAKSKIMLGLRVLATYTLCRPASTASPLG